jgi:rhodanese-related sulfurtransferase
MRVGRGFRPGPSLAGSVGRRLRHGAAAERHSGHEDRETLPSAPAGAGRLRIGCPCSSHRLIVTRIAGTGNGGPPVAATLDAVRRDVPAVEIADVPTPLPRGVVVLDVREPEEWRAGHIDRALHVPIRQLPARVGEVPSDRQVLVVCRVGARSASATAFLVSLGRNAVNLSGGMYAWAAAGRGMVAEGDASPRVA